ncbi:hypothetical protein [Brassicibacter mesophilus]|uniref:hypothetical protein n=1 Tax=Brassicibacter mesophilus TaxID=745119 RepID=UPI003D1A86B9
MSLQAFKSTLCLILEFARKAEKESMPFFTQKIFIKTYASTLKLNLTDKMIEEIILYSNSSFISSFLSVC